ncbi:MAG: hypothetical protein HAW58_06555, partial [Candidatus Thioglobus sp.]|nr:hypothetical protein [Candidatus Thioglobus sp.]
AEAFGDLYQWGRAADGHQQRNSNKRNQPARFLRAVNADFITPTAEPFDWTNLDYNGLQRQEFWSQIDGSGICPTGYRVPTRSELSLERKAWGSQNAAGAFASNLKLPLAEARFAGGGYIAGSGLYWSSDITSTKRSQSQAVFLEDVGAGVFLSSNRARGNSIRCILDASINFNAATEISITSNSVALGATLTLTASVVPVDANNATPVWSILGGNNAIASINGDVISGLALGEVTLRAALANSISIDKRFRVTIAAPANLRAVATGVPNQVTVFWSEAATANYKLYQSANNLSAFAAGDPENLPAGVTMKETSQTKAVIALSGGQTAYFLVTAADATNESFTNSKQAVATNHLQQFTAVNGNGKTVWMDRNLGATRVATNFDDSQAYGDLYQWGRAADGHQRRDSLASSNPNSDIKPNNPDFIAVNQGDWTALVNGNNIDNNGSQRQEFWSRTDGSSICPTGFRVPTVAEWRTELGSWLSENRGGAFISNLKIPTTGIRNFAGGNILSANILGFYWSSSSFSNQSSRLILGGGFAYDSVTNRANGMAVRCIRDPSISITDIGINDIMISSISITSPSQIEDGASFDLTASVSPADSTNKTLTWKIAGGSRDIAVISGSTFSAIAPGFVTVIATANDGSGVTGSQIVRVISLPNAPDALAVVASGPQSRIVKLGKIYLQII